MLSRIRSAANKKWEFSAILSLIGEHPPEASALQLNLSFPPLAGTENPGSISKSELLGNFPLNFSQRDLRYLQGVITRTGAEIVNLSNPDWGEQSI